MPTTTTEKKALKGFAGCRIWPVTTNTAEGYATGTMKKLPWAQSLTKEVTRQEFTIYADDSIYDSGSDYQYETLTLTLTELPLEMESELSGGNFDPDAGVYSFGNNDVPPEYALGYASLMSSGEYRCYVHFAVKLMNIKVDHATKGGTNDIQSYQLTFRSTQRNTDGKVRDTHDSTDKSFGWLDTVFPAST